MVNNPKLVSRDEIESLKAEINQKESGDLQESVENLNESIKGLVQLFKATIIELKSNPEGELAKKIDVLIGKIEESNQLNRELLELQKEHLPKISKKELVRQFQKAPMPQAQTRMQPVQPRIQPQPYQSYPVQPAYMPQMPTQQDYMPAPPKPMQQPRTEQHPFPDIDLPPLDDAPKPKRGFLGFGK